MNTIIVIVLGVILYFGYNFYKDFKKVKEVPFMPTFKTLSNRLNQKFFSNQGIMIMKNEMEYHLVVPNNPLFVVFLKIKYTGKNIHIFAIDTLDNERIVLDLNANPEEVLQYTEQERLADKFCELYNENLKQSNISESINSDISFNQDSSRIKQRNTEQNNHQEIVNPSTIVSKTSADEILVSRRRRGAAHIPQEQIDNANKMITILERGIGRNVNFEDFIKELIIAISYEEVKDAFDFFIDVYESTGRSAENTQDIYNKFFNIENQAIDYINNYLLDQTSETEVMESVEEKLCKRLEKLMFYNSIDEYEVNDLAKDIFSYCLDKSNKDVSFDELTSIEKLVSNPKIMFYAPLYSSLREIIKYSSDKMKNLKVENQYLTAYNSFEAITQNTISEINKI